MPLKEIKKSLGARALRKKKKLIRPWLTPSGVEISTYELKDIVKEWSAKTWDEYLNWYQSGQSEKLISISLYNKIADEVEDSIFSQYGFDTNYDDIEFCNRLLLSLPSHLQCILILIYLEGRTLAEVAKVFNRSTTSIHHHKNKALTALKRGFGGENWNARHYIEGCDEVESQRINSLWDQKLSSPLKTSRSYHEFNFKNELTFHVTPELREIFREMLDLSLELIYLRFFCNFDTNIISRKKYLGLNTAEQIIDAAVFKIKSKLIENLTEDHQALLGQQSSQLG